MFATSAASSSKIVPSERRISSRSWSGSPTSSVGSRPCPPSCRPAPRPHRHLLGSTRSDYVQPAPTLPGLPGNSAGTRQVVCATIVRRLPGGGPADGRAAPGLLPSQAHELHPAAKRALLVGRDGSNAGEHFTSSWAGFLSKGAASRARSRAGPTIRIRCLTVNRYGSGSRRLRADGPSLTPAYELLGSRFVATCPAGWVFRSAPRAF
jgi:hypothetical protein